MLPDEVESFIEAQAEAGKERSAGEEAYDAEKRLPEPSEEQREALLALESFLGADPMGLSAVYKRARRIAVELKAITERGDLLVNWKRKNK